MSISDYEARTAPVSEAEIAFLAEIFGEMIMNERKEQHEQCNDQQV